MDGWNFYKEEEKDIDNENLSSKLVKLDLKEEEKGHNNEFSNLINACKYGNTEKIKKLIKSGVDVNMKNEYGDTPLTILCEKMDLESVKVLINNREKINANVNNSSVDSALNILCKKYDKNSLSIINYLVENGADINYSDENGITPLLTTCYFNNTTTLLHLIDFEKLDINKKNNYEDSPLIVSTYFNNKKIMEILINENANIHLKNKDGDTFQTILKKLKKRKVVLKELNNGNIYIYI